MQNTVDVKRVQKALRGRVTGGSGLASAALALVALVVVAACGETADGGGKSAAAIGPSVAEISAACDRWVASLEPTGVRPERILAPGVGLPTTFSLFHVDQRDPVILGESRQLCVSLATEPDTRIDAAFLDRCRQAIVAALAGATYPEMPAECKLPPGPRAEGTSCILDAQCETLRCDIPAHNPLDEPDVAGACGVCAAALSYVDACGQQNVGESCGPDLACAQAYAPGRTLPMEPSGGQCESRDERLVFSVQRNCGETVLCTDQQYCDADFMCEPVHNIATEGACFSDVQCVVGAVCNASRTCASPMPNGAVCVGDSDCERSERCKRPGENDATPGTPGVCTPYVLEGEVCENTVDCGGATYSLVCVPACAGGKRCVPGTIGSNRFPGVADAPDTSAAPGKPLLVPDAKCGLDTTPPTPSCGTCPVLIADGAPCGAGLVCGPYSACVDGLCRFRDATRCPTR